MMLLVLNLRYPCLITQDHKDFFLCFLIEVEYYDPFGINFYIDARYGSKIIYFASGNPIVWYHLLKRLFSTYCLDIFLFKKFVEV